jgi:FkbM family methyltransferase
MMSLGKRAIGVINKTIFHPLGMRLQRYNSAAIQFETDQTLGRSLLTDLGKLILIDQPIVFDVGANQGQSIRNYIHLWPDAQIVSFEPDPVEAANLRLKYSFLEGVEIVEAAVLDHDKGTSLYRFESSDLNSIHNRVTDGWITSPPTAVDAVPSITLDGFCQDRSITQVDLLKADVQGAEDLVLRGARTLLGQSAFRFVVLELTFCHLYENGCRPGDVIKVMEQNGYQFVALYNQIIQNGRLQWADGLWRAN